jgi:hypothetical protein
LPLNTTAASTSDCTMAPAWVRMSSLRLSLRSATEPAQAPRTRTGPKRQAVSTPMATPDPVRSRTRRVRATDVSQVPVWDTI